MVKLLLTPCILASGSVVPMPTLPAAVIRIFSVAVALTPAAEVPKIKADSFPSTSILPLPSELVILTLY